MACPQASRANRKPSAQGRFSGASLLTTLKSKELHDLLAPSLASLGYDLVQVRLLSGGRPTLQVLAEPVSGNPMGVEDCSTISRHISAVLDVEDPIAGAYNLEVGSPGIDRPLVKAADYERFKGEEAKIELDEMLDGRKRFRGTLEGIADEQVRIRIEEKPGPDKPGATTTYTIPLARIATAKLVLTDELIARDAERRGRGKEETGRGRGKQADRM